MELNFHPSWSRCDFRPASQGIFWSIPTVVIKHLLCNGDVLFWSQRLTSGLGE